MNSPSQPTSENAKSAGSDCSTATILVVDDAVDTRHVICRALEEQGWSVHKASNGVEALALFELVQPDLVVLDLMMPRQSGFLVLEQIRTEQCESVPVIVISALDGRLHQKYVTQFEISDFITKPFQIPTLVDSVSRALEDRLQSPLNQ